MVAEAPDRVFQALLLTPGHRGVPGPTAFAGRLEDRAALLRASAPDANFDQAAFHRLAVTLIAFLPDMVPLALDRSAGAAGNRMIA